MTQPDLIDENGFESEVKKIANHLWHDALNGGTITVDGQERDGVYVSDEIVNLIECTISRSKDKAEKDTLKLVALHQKIQKQYADKAVKAWFITKDEVTADQRAAVVSKGKNLVTAVSFEKFQSKIVDFGLYKSCRQNYAFGSVRDPSTGESQYQGNYVDVQFTDLREEKNEWSIKNIIDYLLVGHKVIIQGHYGVGKSMTLKEIYKKLVIRYDKKEIVKFPVYLNLRDHQGQTNPVEALERHARNIGFKFPDHLVRAWRAGYAILMIDGYDEIAAIGWAGKGIGLRDIRYKSMELVRELLRQNPRDTGVILAGRINYFDSLKECENALSISPTTSILKIGDFSPEQTEKYLKSKSINIPIPDWMPTRPLLLGYLVARGIMEDILAHRSVDSPAEGWDYLIDQVCKRESIIEAGLSAESVREIIEGIACFVRQFQNGLGPVYKADLERVFREKCGYPPDDRALVLLQRLPGLAPQDQQDGSRYFIDHMFANASKAGEVAKFINNPYENKLSVDARKLQDTLEDIGIQVASLKVSALENGVLEDALIQAKKAEAEVLSTDILMCLNFLGKSWTRERINFSGIIIPSFEIRKDVDWSRVTFREVIFKELYIEEIPDRDHSPIFERCVIGKIVGCSNPELLPTEIFIDPIIDSVEEQSTTTTALLNLDLPIGTKVGLTILKKLYLQSGHGRQHHSFFRGLSTNEQAYVDPLLELFRSSDLAYPSKMSSKNKVWQPVKSNSVRVRNILLNRAYKDKIIDDMKFIVP